MTKILLGLLFMASLSIRAEASEILAPEVPHMGQAMMPGNADTFGAGLQELLENCAERLHPEITDGVSLGCAILSVVLLCSLLTIVAPRTGSIAPMAGATAIAGLMFQQTDSLIGLASDTVREICDYGKLLCPVLTAALAAQGGISASAALYTGTTAFITILAMLVSRWILPLLSVFLAFSVAYCAMGEEILKRFSDGVKHLLQWVLKTLVMVFTTYMSITGAVSGTTDAAAMKVTKVVFSSVIPVVGGILSDASESVLVSIGVMKNAAGIYGILAVLSVLAGAFIRLGIRYLVLKITAGLCCLFAGKNLTGLVEDFSTAMGLLLAAVAAASVLVLVSTVCYLKVMG